MEFYLIGYSGHAYVTIESALDAGYKIIGYFENEAKRINPYHLEFLGKEEIIVSNTHYNNASFFVGIGDSTLRANIFEKLKQNNFINIIDPSSNISNSSQVGRGTYIGKNTCINALSRIGEGVIINTSAIIEHECEIGDFTHVAPGAILCGNVKIGKNSFIGANSVVKQGVTVGSNVTIGAGSVVLRDVLSGTVTFGNPTRTNRNDSNKNNPTVRH
jgi:sugar O-acyltransferase (sialic acid O-acetyltransferase NeuD family)